MAELFKLTPIKDRRAVTGKIGKLLDAGGDHHTGTDRYLAVLACENTLIISIIIAVALLPIAFYVMEVAQVDVRYLARQSDYHPLAYQMGTVGYFSYVHAHIMGYVVFTMTPLYFLIFKANVKAGEVDLFRFDEVLKFKKNRNIKNKIKRFLIFLSAFPIGFLGSFYSFIALSLVVRWAPDSGLDDSLIFLTLYLVFSVVSHATSALILYIGSISAYGVVAGWGKFGGK